MNSPAGSGSTQAARRLHAAPSSGSYVNGNDNGRLRESALLPTTFAMPTDNDLLSTASYMLTHE